MKTGKLVYKYFLRLLMLHSGDDLHNFLHKYLKNIRRYFIQKIHAFLKHESWKSGCGSTKLQSPTSRRNRGHGTLLMKNTQGRNNRSRRFLLKSGTFAIGITEPTSSKT